MRQHARLSVRRDSFAESARARAQRALRARFLQVNREPTGAPPGAQVGERRPTTDARGMRAGGARENPR